MTQRTQLTVEQATRLKDGIIEDITVMGNRASAMRAKLLELYEGDGWRALGYLTWRECTRDCFGRSVSWLYDQLRLATFERELMLLPEPQKESFVTDAFQKLESVDAEVPPQSAVPNLSDAQLRLLQEVSIQQGYAAANEVLAEIVEEAGPSPSLGLVKDKVQQRLGPPKPRSGKQYITNDVAPRLLPQLTAARGDDALVLQGRWAKLCRLFTTEWAVVSPVELARSLPDCDLNVAAEHVTHMADWLVSMDRILEERRGRPTD